MAEALQAEVDRIADALRTLTADLAKVQSALPRAAPRVGETFAFVDTGYPLEDIIPVIPAVPPPLEAPPPPEKI